MLHLAQLWYRDESPQSSAQSMQARKGACYMLAGVPSDCCFFKWEERATSWVKMNGICLTLKNPCFCFLDLVLMK